LRFHYRWFIQLPERAPHANHHATPNSTVKIAVTIEKLDLRRGGAEGATAWLIRQLAEHGHEVHIFSRDAQVDLPLGVRFREIRPRSLLGAVKQWKFALQVARHLATDNYDVSIACGRGFAEDIIWAQNGAHAAAVAGQVRSYYNSPVRQTIRRLQTYYSLQAMIYELLERRRYSRTPKPHVIAVSDMVARDVTSYYGLDPSHILVMHNHVVIDYDRFNPHQMAALRAHARSTLQIGKNTTVVLCVAQNFKRKGVRPLIDATTRLAKGQQRNFCVIVAGSTPKYTVHYRNYAKRVGCSDQIYFVGHRRQVEELYAASDVFCLPSFYDPCALTVSEAMASGLPTVTTRANGACELITHGVNGFIVEDPSNPNELADCLRPLFDADTRNRIRKASLESVRSYNLTAEKSRLMEFIEQVAQQKRLLNTAPCLTAASTAV
jgi:UDP-glucose:(heptosyl)LPS alpha-1,3-glucosyltransferase